MSAEKLNLVQWEARVGELPPLVALLAHDLYLDGRAPANAVAEAVRTLDGVGRKGRTQNGGRVPYRTQHACQEAVSQFEALSRELAEAKDSLAKASTPEPWSKSRTSNWIARLGGLPDYIQHVSHGIKRSNPALSTGEAIQRAIGVVKDWASGGKKVDAGTRAAAAKAIAEWEALKAKQHAKGGAKKATEAAIGEPEKLLAAASRLAYVVKPLPNQATFAKRYGNRMANFEGISRALSEGKPLAVATAEKLLDAPEGLPLDFLVEEFVERKQATLILMEALGYGSTPIRARQGKKGSFHGMHGHEKAVRKRKLIPGDPEHPVVDALRSGGKLSEAGPAAATAVAFDPAKHPRQAGGEFGSKGGPAVGHAAGPAGGAQASPVAAKIRAQDPQWQKLQGELAQTRAFQQEHPAGAPLAPDQLQSLGYSNDAQGIVQFQKDNGLPTTGKLDAATQQTVAQVYGSNRSGAAGMPADITGIKGPGAPAQATPVRGAAATGPAGTAGRQGAAGRKTLGKTSAKNINEAVRDAVREAIGDEPLVVMIGQSPPSGWHKQAERDENTDDFDFDDDTQQPPNLREGDMPTVCQTCAHFSPQGWITRRHVLGGCMKYSAQVDRTDLCDSYLTLSPPDATLRIHEARVEAAEKAGDSLRIVQARAALKAVMARPRVQEAIRREQAADEAFRIMESAAGVVEAVDLSKEGRSKLASKKQARPDGSYPIPNVEFLKKAISAYGRAVAAGKGKAVKSWITRRAKALGATNLLPEGW